MIRKLFESTLNHIIVYLGRLAGERTPDENTWSKEIDLAEKHFLIYIHKPAYNSKSLTSIPDDELQDIHILNWGDHRHLLPEIWRLQWTSKLDYMKYDIYRYTVTK